MNIYKINITFENLEKCNEWERENLKDQKYNNEPILSVMHSASCRSEEVTLREIWTV